MLSRVALVTPRNAWLKSQCLIATARGIQGPHSDIHRRQYHIASNKTVNSSNQLAGYVLKSKNLYGVSSVRNLSSTGTVFNAAAASSATTSVLPSIPDAPVIPIQEIAEAVAGAEPTFLSLGLGGWSPVGIVQNYFEFLHVGCDLSWWAAIAVVTLSIRTLVVPLVIFAQRSAARMHNNMPAIQKLQAKVTEARQMGNAMEVARHSHEQARFMKQMGMNPLRSAMVPMAQAPIFISMFVGIRQMVNAPVESLSTGGILWFPDLTVSDPLFILPAITSLTLLATIELGIDSGKLNADNMQIVRYGLRALPFIIFPFTMNFPGAMLFYWTCSNAISLVQALVLKIPAARDLCKIERLIAHPTDPAVKKKKFIAGVKETWSNLKLQNELENRKRLDGINFERAGQGTVVRTYKFDPTKVQPSLIKEARKN